MARILSENTVDKAWLRQLWFTIKELDQRRGVTPKREPVRLAVLKSTGGNEIVVGAFDKGRAFDDGGW